MFNRVNTQNYIYSYNNILSTIHNKISDDILFHALLIYGDCGTGKSFLSQDIAKKIVNCNIFTVSHKIDLNLSSIYTAFKDCKVITVNDIRKCNKWSSLRSIKLKYKIIIIDDIDKINNNANNAFLKFLEDPIGKIIFIINTSCIYEISQTLRSRCIKIKLKKPSIKNFGKILNNLDCLKLNIKLGVLYFLCKSNINLAVTIIKNKYWALLIKIFDNYFCNQTLNFMNELNLEHEINLRVFNCFVGAAIYKLTRKCIEQKQTLQEYHRVTTALNKSHHIMTNRHKINKKYLQIIIINLLKECL